MNLISIKPATAKKLLALGLLGSAWALPASAVTASAPPPAIYYFGVPTGFSLFPPSLPEVDGAGVHQSGAATATLGLTPSPTIDLEISQTDGKSFFGTGIRYFYTIDGPAFLNGGTVEGTLTTSMSVSGAASGSIAAAALLTATGLGVDAGNAVCYSTIGICPGGFGTSLQDQVLHLNFGASGEIDLAAAARVVGSGTASVLIDPVITLPEGYTLTLSPGIGNSPIDVTPTPSAVPEPSTYALMLAGLGVVGATARRKTKTRA